MNNFDLLTCVMGFCRYIAKSYPNIILISRPSIVSRSIFRLMFYNAPSYNPFICERGQERHSHPCHNKHYFTVDCAAQVKYQKVVNIIKCLFSSGTVYMIVIIFR